MANCVLPMCGVQRIPKYAGIGIFKVTTRKGEFYEDWRQKLINVILKYRVMTEKDLRTRIFGTGIYICERHFLPKEIECTKTGLKSLALLAVPTQQLPQKSYSHEVAERRPVVRSMLPPKQKSLVVYETLEDMIRKIGKLKLNGWTVDYKTNLVTITKWKHPHKIPFIVVTIDESLAFSCQVYDWKMPLTHELYYLYKRSIRKATISELLSKISLYHLCPGLEKNDPRLLQHVVPTENNDDDDDNPLSVLNFNRSIGCHVVITESGICESCKDFRVMLEKELKKQGKKLMMPAKPNAPLGFTHPQKVILALQDERKAKKIVLIENKKLKDELDMMKAKIEEDGVELNPDMASDINNIMDANKNTASPFMQLFWEQQKMMVGKKKDMKYHPMIIRFCLSLAAKSSSAYDELRDSKILTLPSRRTLRDYRNAVKPAIGFNPEVLEELCQLTKDFTGHQKYVTLAFDEMKVKENLVFDKTTRQLIGFIDIGDPDLNYENFGGKDELATHIFVYYVRGISTDLKFSLATFATKTMEASQIMSTFWEAVGVCKWTCGLKVIAAAADGASANRKFFDNHSLMNENDGTAKPVVHCTTNIHARERKIFFFADAPHLIKTVRNAIYHSGINKQRHLWHNEKQIIWGHFCKLINDEMTNGIKLHSALTPDHVNLNSYSKMNVRLAAQILSNRVGCILKTYYSPEMDSTSNLCLIMNDFFDILNIRCQDEGHNKRNTNLEPFRSINDERFTWLLSHFLKHFDSWKAEIDAKANLSDDLKNRMFLPRQTYEGLQITTHSLIGVTKYLLNAGMPYVLTSRFNQDCLEEHFGRHRSLGRRSTNPSIHQVGYQDNTLRIQRSIVTPTGNTKGAYHQKRKFSWFNVDESVIKKAPRTKTNDIDN